MEDLALTREEEHDLSLGDRLGLSGHYCDQCKCFHSNLAYKYVVKSGKVIQTAMEIGPGPTEISGLDYVVMVGDNKVTIGVAFGSKDRAERHRREMEKAAEAARRVRG